MQYKEKYEALQNIIRECGSVAIAFSSGVDSSFLLKAAVEAVGVENVLAITASSAVFPKRERNEAEELCRELGVRHIVFKSPELDLPEFRSNPTNRCYICKKALFLKITELAEEKGIHTVCEGSNVDDLGDYRPGLVAIDELGIKSPLREAGLTKEEIRALSKELGLPTWSKKSYACLASRFVYGETIDKEKLHMVEQAEDLLMGLGFGQLRVRIHDRLARIEVEPEELMKVMEQRELIYSELKKMGFSYVTLDLKGYRMGSMNETIGR